jgi:hypothetical protein
MFSLYYSSMEKRAVIVLSLFLFLVPGVMCQDFGRIVDFQKTLKDVSLEAAEAPAGRVSSGKYLILEGSVASRRVVNAEPETFVGEIELVDGDWVGVESVNMWSCIVQFSGPEYVSRIPAGRTRKASPDEILLNSQVLVVGKLIEIRDVGGRRIPVVRGEQIRTVR